MQELVLDRNRIRYLDADAFVGLPRLRELRIEDNGLRSLAHLSPHLAGLQVERASGRLMESGSELTALA
jgi:hypothetical protein